MKHAKTSHTGKYLKPTSTSYRFGERMTKIAVLAVMMFGLPHRARAQTPPSDTVVLRGDNFELNASEVKRFIEDSFSGSSISNLKVSRTALGTMGWAAPSRELRAFFYRTYFRKVRFNLSSGHYIADKFVPNIEISCSLRIDVVEREISVSLCELPDGGRIGQTIFFKPLSDYTLVN
jgi:hypothetical protein